MQRYYTLIIICVMVVGGSQAYAQWVSPIKPSHTLPHLNLPRPLHVGVDWNDSGMQYKLVGDDPTSPVGVGLVIQNAYDDNLDASFTPPPPGTFSFYANAGFLIQHKNFPTDDYVFDPKYGLSTNAPIRVNGIYSHNDIVAAGSIDSAGIIVSNLKNTDLTVQQNICVQDMTGKIIPCTSSITANQAVDIAMYAVPATIPVGENKKIQIFWDADQTQKMGKCTAVQVPGFVSADLVDNSGGSRFAHTWSDPTLFTDSTDSIEFTIMCNTNGVLSFGSVSVSAS